MEGIVATRRQTLAVMDAMRVQESVGAGEKEIFNALKADEFIHDRRLDGGQDGGNGDTWSGAGEGHALRAGDAGAAGRGAARSRVARGTSGLHAPGAWPGAAAVAVGVMRHLARLLGMTRRCPWLVYRRYV